jgi:HK97 family phage portal protein
MPNAVVVQSLGSLTDWTPDWLPRHFRNASGYPDFTHDYAAIYRTQPNVRTVVEFLARNIAQLGLHVFRRVSDTDRVRLIDHGLAQTIKRPNPWTTRYRLIEALISDMAIYNRAYWLKVKLPEQSLALLRIPPHLVRERGNYLVSKSYKIELGEGKALEPTPDQIVHFRGYSPDNNVTAISPLETLRRVLAQDDAASGYREKFWRNAARQGGVIERPAEAPEWSDVARSRFLQEFQAMYSGEVNSGTTAILEDGMTWKAGSFSAEQSQWYEGTKLTMEQCARAYHIPLPMVGILDHATFSNITEQHKNLYQDTLGPWLSMVPEEIDLQLTPEFDDREGVYVEFNIQEKLQGSFEEQVKALQAAVGAPWMTRAQARAVMNQPKLDDPTADELVTPLNVLIGGQASPQDSAPPAEGAPKALPTGSFLTKPIIPRPKLQVYDPTNRALRARHREKYAQVLVSFFGRQSRAVESALPKRRVLTKTAVDDIFNPERWNGELKADLYRLSRATAIVWARDVAEALDGDLDEDRMDEYLGENARIAAERINATTSDELARALAGDEPRDLVRRVFEVAMGARAAQIAFTKVTNAANFGAHEGAKQSGTSKKTWQVNSGNPRSAHAELNGETVGMGKNFSNGMRWPADGTAGLGADQIANCECSVVFQRS